MLADSVDCAVRWREDVASMLHIAGYIRLTHSWLHKT